MKNRFPFSILLLACLCALITGNPAFAPIQGNPQFQEVSKTVNDQIIAVNEAAGEEVITPPQEQKGIMRLGISPSPSVTPSSSVTPSPSVTSTPSPSVTPSTSASVTPSASSSSTPSRSPNASQSSAPARIECPPVLVNGRPIPESEYSAPANLTPNEPSAQHSGVDSSVCQYYVNVPDNAKTYTATFTAVGTVALFLAFDGYPYTRYANSADDIGPKCVTITDNKDQCEDDLPAGTKKVYVRTEGWSTFSNGILNVSFDILKPTPSPDPNARLCPVLATSNNTPLEFPADTPVGKHYGQYGSVCSYYVKVPSNSVNYEASVQATGDVDLYVAFKGPPASYFTDGGVSPVCTSNSASSSELCAGDLVGNDIVYLKVIGWETFDLGIVSVMFNVPHALP